MSNDPFQSIRPYRDSEVSEVLNRLLYNEELIDALARYQYPGMTRWLGWAMKPMIRIGLARWLGDIENVKAFQQLVARYMEKMISRTTTKLSCSGLEELDPDESYLFISNHRDIAMDPAFMNWVLFKVGMDTVRIAIGDNLLKKSFISDLMRLNKSFIVNRSAKAPRELLAALTQLSEYIDHSLHHDGQSVWIAQREGRAKDGNDLTDPAILKMFYMAHRKKRSFKEAMQRLNIVPVSISYEYDPCDQMKAKELLSAQSGGSYKKGPLEDIQSIVQGITGFKGNVHVAFGTPIQDGFETPEELAGLIDQQIIANYHLHPSNYVAAGISDKVTNEDQALFEQRLAMMMEGASEIVKSMYANPVLNKQKLGIDG